MRDKVKQQAAEHRELEFTLLMVKRQAGVLQRMYSAAIEPKPPCALEKLMMSRKKAEENRAAKVVEAAENVVGAFGNVLEIGPALAKLKEALEGEVWVSMHEQDGPKLELQCE